MTVIDVRWTPNHNEVLVLCNCGNSFWHSTRISLGYCHWCGRAELWHGMWPKPEEGPWSEPEMVIHVHT